MLEQQIQRLRLHLVLAKTAIDTALIWICRILCTICPQTLHPPMT